MISLPAPEEPPMMETTRLGAMATILVTKFLIHFFIFKSRKPYITNQTKPKFSNLLKKTCCLCSLFSV